MAIFCATYQYRDGSDATRDEIRPAHREWLQSQPNLLLSGPTDAGGAVLFFEGSSAGAVEALLEHDPFASAGVIETRRVVGWTPVSGRWRAQLQL